MHMQVLAYLTLDMREVCLKSWVGLTRLADYDTAGGHGDC